MIQFLVKGDEKAEANAVERLFVVWGQTGPRIIAAMGKMVEPEIGIDPESFEQELAVGITGGDPDHGVWIWEGIPIARWSPSTPNAPEEYEGLDFTGGKWRLPTLREISAFMNGRCIWLEEETNRGGNEVCRYCGRPCPESSIGSLIDPMTGYRVHGTCHTGFKDENDGE